MNNALTALQRALRNRKAELQQLIRQMKTDELNKSSVFKNLNTELETIEGRLQDSSEQKK